MLFCPQLRTSDIKSALWMPRLIRWPLRQALRVAQILATSREGLFSSGSGALAVHGSPDIDVKLVAA